MPIIGTLAGASARGFGGMKTFGGGLSSLAAVYMPGTGSSFQVFNVGPETITAFPSGLATVSGLSSGGLGNNTVAGYMQEAWVDGADFSKISFVTQVASFKSGGVKDGGAGVSNDGTAGYTGGGTAGGAYLNTILKVTYSTDAVSTAGGTIYAAVIQNYAWSTGSSFGYIGAGFNQSATTNDTVSKYNYSNETATTMGAGVVSLRLGAAASSASKGYIFGGYNNGGSNVNTIQSWTYSNDTQATLGATLSAARRENDAGGTYSLLYSFGGSEASAVLTIQKFTTSAETISTIGTSLTYGINSGQNNAANNRGA
jgi:hypothetical protein